MAVAAIVAAFAGQFGQTGAVMAAEPEHSKPHFSGVADYYADMFHGRRTASGQPHDKTKLMAAHRTLPFGTKVKLINRRNKRSCIVVINDRGPFTHNRVIDVSKQAAQELGLFSGHRMLDCYIVNGKNCDSLRSQEETAVGAHEEPKSDSKVTAVRKETRKQRSIATAHSKPAPEQMIAADRAMLAALNTFAVTDGHAAKPVRLNSCAGHAKPQPVSIASARKDEF